jgi:opacity protein-like surface antigen
MKKILLLLAMGLLFAGSVSAQQYYYGPRRVVHRRRAPERRNDDDFNRVKVGITGGLNVANQVSSYNGSYSTGTIAGFNAGLYLDVPLIYPLSFEPEVLYSQKGFSANDNGDHFTSRQNFIDVPLLAKFHLTPGFNFLIGPQLSFLSSTTNTESSGFTLISQDHTNYSGANTFLDGVIGVSFDLNRNVELRARYTIDFNATSPYGETFVPDYRNQVWQIGLGINFQ